MIGPVIYENIKAREINPEPSYCLVIYAALLYKGFVIQACHQSRTCWCGWWDLNPHGREPGDFLTTPYRYGRIKPAL